MSYLRDTFWAAIYVSPKIELFVNNIGVRYASPGIARRAGELYAEHLLKNRKRVFKRILPDFIIGAYERAV